MAEEMTAVPLTTARDKETQASSSSTRLSDAPVVSGNVVTVVTTYHPKTAEDEEFQKLVNEWIASGCLESDPVFGPKEPKRLVKQVCRLNYERRKKSMFRQEVQEEIPEKNTKVDDGKKTSHQVKLPEPTRRRRPPKEKTFEARHGTGHRQVSYNIPISLWTDKSCKVVAPAQRPNKKTVLVVGDGQLRALINGAVTIPEGRVSFGFLSVHKATLSDLKTELIHANIPWKPDAVCVCIPVCNVKQSIPKAVEDLDSLLAAASYQWPRVFVLDFPTDLIQDPVKQDALRQEYRSVTESVGLTYVPVAEHFPSDRLELWAYDGKHLSDDGGVPVLLQLLQVAADQQLAALLQETHAGDQCEAEETAAESPASCQEPSPTWMSDVDEPEMTDAEQDQDEDADEEQSADPAPLPETSVVSQCEVEQAAPQSATVCATPLSAEPPASCQASSSTRLSDAPVVSGNVATVVTAYHPKTAEDEEFQKLVNEWIASGCLESDPVFGPKEPKRLVKQVCRLNYERRKKSMFRREVQEEIPEKNTKVDDGKKTSHQVKLTETTRPRRPPKEKTFGAPSLVLERQWAALMKTERSVNNLEEKYNNKKETFNNYSQTLQSLKDKVRKQNRRIAHMRRILSKQDSEIDLLKEELRLSRLAVVWSSKSVT